MLFLINILLALWVSCAEGQVKPCDFPEIKNGRLHSEDYYREYFPVEVGRSFYYYCNSGFVTPTRYSGGYLRCTREGWSPKAPCRRECYWYGVENGYSLDSGRYRLEGDSVSVQCTSGYSLPNGGSTITCTESGWSPPPKCIRVMKPCDFPEIKNGRLHSEDYYREYFPVEVGRSFYYYCNSGFVTPTRHSGGYLRCTREGWSPKAPCHRECYWYGVENGYSTDSGRYRLEGDSVSVQCTAGYSLPNGHSIITCTESGWSPPPKCIRVKTCSKLDIHIENGFFSEYKYEYPVNQQTQYNCKPGYITADGKTSGLITCLENGWSTLPKCVKSCDKPLFVNARTKSNGTKFKLSDKVDYECNAGYENSGGNTIGSIVCGDDGWSDTPTCYERECNVPVLSENVNASPRKNKFKVGEVLRFSCRSNFKMVGPDSTQCYHFGLSPSPPTCKERVRSCGSPPQIPNGDTQGEKNKNYEHSDVVEYVCNPGYLVKGSKKIQCVDGEWTALPICVVEERTCGEIPTLQHGYSLSSDPPYHHGDFVELSCRESFTMVGYKSITCVGGNWTRLPQCIATEQLQKCKVSGINVFDSIPSDQTEFHHNTNFNYKCKRKSEYKQTTCINGKWDPELTCAERQKPQSCPPPPQIPHAEGMTTTVNYQNGEKISILCQENYLIQDHDEILCKDGKWQSLPRCIEKLPCSQPPNIEHGKISSSRFSEERKETSESSLYSHGTKLTYTCEDGFKLSEETGITCHMGKWSSPPQCVGLSCPPPPLIPNGFLSRELESYQHGQEATYNCTEGFGIDGPESIKCWGGKWPALPKCQNTDCSEVPVFANAIFKGPEKESYQSGEEVEYDCKKDFQLEGPNIVKCIKSKWIGSPTCTDISCGNPPKVENAHVISRLMTRYPPGERVRYECDERYSMYGEVEVMCLRGTWTEAPQCKDPQGRCGYPPPIENGDITSFTLPTYADGSTVEYQCQDLYELQGNKHVTCRNGRWSEPPKCLEACVVSEEMMEKHHIQLKWRNVKKIYSRSSDTVEFTCKWGYKQKTAKQTFQATCHEGKLEYPSCEYWFG